MDMNMNWSFFGQNDYSNLFNRITFLSATTNTPVEIRDQMLANLSTGLLFFSLQRNKNFDKNFDQNLDRKSKDSAVVASKPKETKDPWNKWVFNIGANGNLSGEETSEFTNYSFDFSAKQVTEMNKFYIRWSYTNAKSKFTFGETTINSINRLSSLNIGNTFSIAKHWSIGGFLQVGSSDYANLSLYTSFKPAIEYSIFPYEEASKKQITVSYLIGGINNVYNEKTIFNKEEEFLWEHSIKITGNLRQKWGSSYGLVSYSSYLRDKELHALQFLVRSNFRVFQGLSFNITTTYSITNNQINLASGNLTLDELLLKQQQVKSGYVFSVGVGFSYSFGSIYNDIVNPRLGF